MIKINGEILDTCNIKLIEYLNEKNYNPNRIAVELNGEIIPRSNYEKIILKSGDTLEIVTFVGGG